MGLDIINPQAQLVWELSAHGHHAVNLLHLIVVLVSASQVVLVVKNWPASVGDTGDPGLIPELGRSPGVGNGNPLQYS